MQSKNVLEKNLINSKLLKKYASWMYCEHCNSTVGYLCYTTYSYFRYEFDCKCGNKGLVEIRLEEIRLEEIRLEEIRLEECDQAVDNNVSLKLVKNRLCCPKDDSPLFSVVEKNLNSYRYYLVCKSCKNIYQNS